MSYQVLARRFRPQTFAEVVGQDAILHSLRSSLTTGRVPHALLFSGSRGVGKTTLARILARCLNCETGITADPCGKCASCESVLTGHNGDVVEIDAASHNLVDDIRELRDRVGFASMGARYKVYILDEVHMLTRSAFNAFLKTLEEPPPNVVFILATTEAHKVPETIRSRCQVHTFARVGEADIRRRLRGICDAEKVALEDGVLADIAASSRGGMRDAETALERVLPVARQALEAGESFGLDDYRRLVRRSGPDKVMPVLSGMLSGDAGPGLRFVDDVVGSGIDEREALGELLELLRAVLLLQVDGADSGLVAFSGELRDQLMELAKASKQPQIEAMIQAGLLGRERIRRLDDRRLVLELTLVRMAQAGELPLLGELVAELRANPAAAAAPTVSSSGAAAPRRASTKTPAAKASQPKAGGKASASQAAPVSQEPIADLRERLIDVIAEQRPLFRRTIELCSFEGPDRGGVVRVKMKTDQRMHVDRITAPGVQDELAGFLQQIVGRPVQVRVEASVAEAPKKASAKEAKGKAKTKNKPQVKPDSSVQKVLDRFDGQILDVESQESDGSE